MGRNTDCYYLGLNKVYDYIDSNLTEDLSLEVLCEISGYSGYHFHRLFHALTGKTIHEYVLDRRMNSAASRLLYDNGSITKIALDCGFSSSSSFSRIFKQFFGCTPSYFRKYKVRRRPLASSDHNITKYESDPALKDAFTLSFMPDMYVAGIITKGLSEDFVSSNINNAFSKLFKWLKSHNFVNENNTIMGITLDTPEVVPYSECRYFACVNADKRMQPEGEIAIRNIPSMGNYVCFSMERSQSGFSEKFFRITDYLYRYHLPEINKYPDNRPFIEFYSQKGLSIQITFCVPVK